jgi:hypothetical protein
MIPHDVIVVAFETETLAGAGEGGYRHWGRDRGRDERG